MREKNPLTLNCPINKALKLLQLRSPQQSHAQPLLKTSSFRGGCDTLYFQKY